jgi:hypothetical protein
MLHKIGTPDLQGDSFLLALKKKAVMLLAAYEEGWVARSLEQPSLKAFKRLRPSVWQFAMN